MTDLNTLAALFTLPTSGNDFDKGPSYVDLHDEMIQATPGSVPDSVSGVQWGTVTEIAASFPSWACRVIYVGVVVIGGIRYAVEGHSDEMDGRACRAWFTLGIAA